jgi:hypothetical protein
MAELKRFLVELDAFDTDTKTLLSELTLRAVFLVMGDVVAGSPVRTGRFRASWFVGVGQPVRAVAAPRQQPAGSEAESVARLVEIRPETVTGFDPVYITNNLPYASRLAEGSSKQAPNGWVDQAVSRAAQEIQTVKVEVAA